MTIRYKDLAAAALALFLLGSVPGLGAEKAAKVTAEDQSDAPRDVELTRKIRKAVTEEEALSIRAKNVQIITRQGQVLLKGEVASQEEKAKVMALAGNIAGSANVKSELTIASH